ncbi:MAG: hypothetical protein Q7K43_06360 [Candidatus Woesearchaeota archaeon]|nr:hypothetical protein [Candidatus Woesearchaeota archaeon]
MTFTVRQLVFMALLGAITFVFDLAFVSGIDASTGIPGAGFMVDTIFVVALMTIGGLVIKRFGVFSSIALIYGVLAVPTTVFGPPGAYKIVLSLVLGLVADAVVYFFKYKRIGFYSAMAIGNVFGLPLFLLALRWLGLPGSSALASAFWVILAVTVVESLIGAWLGLWLFEKRIKNLAVIRQLQSRGSSNEF